MGLLVPEADRILARYEAKRTAKGFEFTPPPEKAPLGRFAFPADVFMTIFLGVITEVLAHATVYLLSLPFHRRQSVSGAEPKPPPAEGVASLIAEVKKSTNVVQEAIRKLQEQGVNADDANAAVELLLESVQEVTTEMAVKAAH